MSDVPYLQWLVLECGYRDVRPIGPGRYVAIMPLAFTAAIITGRIGDMCGLDDRWCYHDYRSARAALEAWDGEGEPAGWHRHPASGRRVSEAPDERDENGHMVGAIGVQYIRG